MDFFDEFKNAVSVYPRDHVNLDFVQVIAPGTTINKDETVQFKIRINNNGPLTLENVQLHIKGEQDTLVRATSSGAWVSEFNAGALTVAGDGSQESATFYFKPTKVVDPAAQLVSANISQWNAALGRILNGYSNGTPYPTVNYIHEVAGN